MRTMHLLDRPILDYVEDLKDGRSGHDSRVGRAELLTYIETSGLDTLAPARAYLLEQEVGSKAVPLAHMHDRIGVAFPRALALAQGRPGYTAPASNAAWFASHVAPNRKLAMYYSKLSARLSQLSEGPELEDPHSGYQAELIAVEALVDHVDRRPGRVSAVANRELQQLIRDATRKAQYGVYDPTLRLMLPTDALPPGGDVRSLEIPVGRGMSMEARFDELHGDPGRAGEMRELVSRWYPDASIALAIRTPSNERFTLLQVAPILGYERPFTIVEQVVGSVSFDHYGKGLSRYSPDETELPFRIYREANADLGGRNVERVKLVCGMRAYYAALLREKR
jgi:hypothetical protein